MKLPFKIDLKDKVVVVTGGSGILLSEFCYALAECDAKVAVLGLSLEECEKVSEKINSNGGTAIAVEANVLNKQSLEIAKEKINLELGPIDILVNGAGGNNPKATTDNEFLEKIDLLKDSSFKTFYDLDVDGIEFVFNLNFLGTLLPTQVFSLDMVDKEEGVVLNISSMNSFTPLTKIPAYSGAKAAINNFTQWLAVHMSHVGIRVNAVAPGFFLTTQNESLLKNPDDTWTERAEKIITNTPMGRLGKNEELIGTMLYLIDNNSASFVTGVIIPVDGGFSSYSGV